MTFTTNGLVVDRHPIGTLRHNRRKMRRFAMRSDRISDQYDRLAFDCEPILPTRELLPAGGIEGFNGNTMHHTLLAANLDVVSTVPASPIIKDWAPIPISMPLAETVMRASPNFSVT